MLALEGNVRLRRWWNGAAGIPARALMRLTSAQLPRSIHDGIQLVVGDINDAPSSERYAAWLLYASGIARGERRAQARVGKILAALDDADSRGIADWLASVKGGSP